MTYVALQVQYPDDSWRTIVVQEEDKYYNECVCYEHEGTYYRNLAADSDYEMYDYNYCECEDDHKMMWFEEDGDFWKLNIDITHEDFINTIQVEMASLADIIEPNFRFTWKDGADYNID